MSRPRLCLEHGTYGYARREKCKCDPCRKAVAAYAKQLAAKKTETRADAEPVRRHVQRLVDAGASYNQIVNATDGLVTKEQVKNLIEGNANWHGKKVTWLMPHTARTLLYITYDMAMEAGFTYVSAVGVHRRLEALRWMGYSLPALSEHLPLTYTALHHFTKRQRVRTTSVKMIDELYQKLQHTPGPDDREKWRAYRAGLLPPAAWDDATIDDPQAEPDLEAVRCIVEKCPNGCYKASLCNHHYRKAYEEKALDRAQNYRRAVARYAGRQVRDPDGILEDIRELRALGFTMQAAAMRLGRPVSYIERIWSKAA